MLRYPSYYSITSERMPMLIVGGLAAHKKMRGGKHLYLVIRPLAHRFSSADATHLPKKLVSASFLIEVYLLSLWRTESTEKKKKKGSIPTICEYETWACTTRLAYGASVFWHHNNDDEICEMTKP